MRKICIFTGTRAEYGLLKPLMKAILNDPELELQVLVSGMHLSPEFGLTYREIENDGFHISEKVEILLNSDSSASISKAVGLGLITFCDSLQRLRPDLLVILGDRFESFAAATTAMLSRIPIAHIHGGEATFGLIDEPIRHSITKMSHLHFTSTDEYRKRVIQLGEQPNRVFNVGALGIENIRSIKLLNKQELEESINFSMGEKCILLTFHPTTLEECTAETQFHALLDAIEKIDTLRIIFTKANADTNGRVINQLIDEYQRQHPDKAITFSSMGQLRYVSAMRLAQVVVGNSSSGIIEAPALKIPTVNIGDRQKGRMMPQSVINCQPNAEAIYASLCKALSAGFRRQIESQESPYEKLGTSQEIKKILKEFPLTGIIKKEFFNISMSDYADN